MDTAINQSFEHNILMRSIKIMDIVFIYTLSVLFAFYVAIFLDTYVFHETDEKAEEKKSYLRNLFEICVVIGIIGVVSYIGRNIIELIPFPFDGYKGYSHAKVKELKSGGMLNVFLLMFSTAFVLRTTALKEKILHKKIVIYE